MMERPLPAPLTAMRKAEAHLQAAAQLLALANEDHIRARIRGAVSELRSTMRSRSHSSR